MKLGTIKLQDEVSVKLTGNLMLRLQAVLTDLIMNGIGQEEYPEVHKRIIVDGGEPKSVKEESLITLYTLIVEFEMAAKEQGKVVEAELPSDSFPQ